MPDRPRVLLLATQDTKEDEARFLREHLELYGCDVVHLDPSVRRTIGGAEISPEQVTAAAGMTIEACRALGHEGKCIAVMIEGAVKLALETHARTPLSGALALGGSVEEAVATARPFLEAKYAAYAEWGQDKALPGQESFRVPFEDLARDRFVLGTPDEVIEQIEERVRRLDSNYLIFRMGWPGMESAKILRVIEMMGRDVLPYFHGKYGRG